MSKDILLLCPFCGEMEVNRMTCKDCLHYEACKSLVDCIDKLVEHCEQFTDKSEWVHLPCKIGDEVYHKSLFSDIIVSSVVKEILFAPYGYQIRALDNSGGLRCFEKYEKGVKWFITKEEIEAALKEKKKGR